MGLEQPICSLLTNILQTLWLRNGSITTGDRSLKDIDLKWWRSQIGLVQQEPFLFNDSIYRNVEHGLVGTQWENAPLETKKDLVKQACAEAFADEFIDRLPEVSRYTSTVVSACLQSLRERCSMLICSTEVLNHRRRIRHQTQRRATPTTGHSKEHSQAPQDADPRRSDQ